MDKKMMTVIGVVAVVIMAAVGAVLLLGNNNGSPSQTSVNILTLQKNETSPAYSPLDKAAVYNGSYPLARYLYLYTDGVPASSSSIYMWLDFVLNEAGQQLVNDAGFYELQSSDLAAMKAQLAGGSNTSVTGDFKESGSTTMAEISTLWAFKFKADTGISVTLSTPGSGAGIKDFYSGKVDIAQASRAMTSAEKDSAAANGITPVEWKVAVDGIAIITHKDNPVGSLTMSQLEAMFNGTITNWNEVGGNDQAINLFGRDSASGSYASFSDLVLVKKENYSASMQQFNTNALIVPEVENNRGGIGYVGIGYAKEASGTSSSVGMSSFLVCSVRLLDQ